MSRKLTKVDFARVWGWNSRLSGKDWKGMVALRNEQDEEMIVPAAMESKTRAPRKAKPGATEGGA